jgi:hypothetical protein
MKTELQTALVAFIPTVAVKTVWYRGWLSSEGAQEWDAEVQVSTIVNGDIYTGSAYLGGVMEQAGDDPKISNPTISGYEIGLTHDALTELSDKLPKCVVVQLDIAAAIEYLSSL